MKTVKRYDYQENAIAKPEMTPEGFLKVAVRATRTGVLIYKTTDGQTIRELRHPDEVFKPESMETLALKPFTNKHPDALLTSEDARNHMVGMTGEVVRKVDDKYLEVMCVITDAETIKEAMQGIDQVSPGYVCELDFTPGEYMGEKYDAIQRNIRYNHLAKVKKGRSGPEVRMRLDADDAAGIELNQEKEKKRMKMKLNGKDYEVDDEIGAAMDAEIKNKARPVAEEMDAAKKAKDKAEAKSDALETENDKLTAKVDGLESELKKVKAERKDGGVDEIAIRKAAKERMRLERIATAVGVEKFDEMSDLDLKKAVIVIDSPEAKLEGKTEDYVNARFDVTAENIDESDEAAKKLGEKLAGKGGNQEAEVTDADDARQKMIDRQRNQWKPAEEKKGA